jgi:hypothetical protein
MYFIKYQPLKEKLRTRALSDREALPYLIILTALITFSSMPGVKAYNDWDWVSLGLGVILAIGGVLYSYRENGGNAGFDFIQKFVVLGWIVGVRCFLVFMPLIILFSVLNFMAEDKSLETTGPYHIVGQIFAATIFYQRIGRHIRDTRSDVNETVAEVDSISHS